MAVFNLRGLALLLLSVMIAAGLHGIPLGWPPAIAVACVPAIAIDVGLRQRGVGAIVVFLPAWVVALVTLVVAVLINV
jgi:hypothetical protein